MDFYKCMLVMLPYSYGVKKDSLKKTSQREVTQKLRAIF